MKLILPALLLLFSRTAIAGYPIIPDSTSPDGTLFLNMNVDRDPSIHIEWKGDDYPKIEICEVDSNRVVGAIDYFGVVPDSETVLREKVKVHWKQDSSAVALLIDDRNYSNSRVLSRYRDGRFREVMFPTYEEMTGFPTPDSNHLRARGRGQVLGWSDQGYLVYYLFLSPTHEYTGDDPLEHTIELEIVGSEMKTRSNQSSHTTPASAPR